MGYAEEAMPDIQRRISALESEVAELRARMEGIKGEIETQVRDRVEEVEGEKTRQELMARKEQLLREYSTKRTLRNERREDNGR